MYDDGGERSCGGDALWRANKRLITRRLHVLPIRVLFGVCVCLSVFVSSASTAHTLFDCPSELNECKGKRSRQEEWNSA